MQGYTTLWLPGTDHAGIATQNVVERQLLAEGLDRERLGREAFVQRVWKWKQQSGNTILDQLKQLGASCDWSRLRFTMDEGLSHAVRDVFVRLYQEGLIYRGQRLINWCPRCLTALSDIEVEHEPVKGKLYHIQYPLVDDPSITLIVATTRPETMLGDTAIAIHPDDSRFNHLIGKQVSLPLTARTIPIVSDPILVDRAFGTGVVKITPAHDFNDFEAGLRHHLPTLSIFDPQARLDPEGLKEAHVDNEVGQQLNGLTISEARKRILDLLEAHHFLVNIEDHELAIGRCYRCKTIVEPFLSPQWFVKIQPLAKPAIEAVQSGRVRIIPESWINNYLGWMRDIKDWCISRQIWWGHQIPAWYCPHCAGIIDPSVATQQSSLIPQAATPIVSQTAPASCPSCGSTELFQDPDVLDTWFSSALWPFSTLGWPKQTSDFKIFYPTSTLVTGLDILFFWVSRMIMIGLKFTGDVPFRDVYIHALVRDAEGKKMSKSKGNVIDPLTKMRQYGTDALRFTLASMASPGRDIKLTEERIEGNRNFVTKIWNAARFIHLHTAGTRCVIPPRDRSFADRWILSRLNGTIGACHRALESYRFDAFASSLYQFLWHEYCDWYIELVKPVLQTGESPEAQSTRQTLIESFEVIQRLLHPAMPFLTEEIWQHFPHCGPSIVRQPFPSEIEDWKSPESEVRFRLLDQFVTTVRMARSLLNYAPALPLHLLGTSTNEAEVHDLRALHPHLEHLGRGNVQITSQDDWSVSTVLRLIVGTLTIGITIGNDLDAKQVLQRIQKQVQAKQKEASRLKSRLSSPQFTSNAMPSVVQESEQRLKNLTEELALLASSAEQLNLMVN